MAYSHVQTQRNSCSFADSEHGLEVQSESELLHERLSLPGNMVVSQAVA